MDIKDFQLVPYTQRHYAPFDPDDPYTPFVSFIFGYKIEEEEGEGLSEHMTSQRRSVRVVEAEKSPSFDKYLEVTHCPFFLIFKRKPFYFVESIFF